VGYVIETMSGEQSFGNCWREMPQNIEEVFTANGLSLFPLHWLISAANAPAQSQPLQAYRCVTTSWVISVKTRLLFQLRGRTKDQIIAALRQLRAASVKSQT